MVKRSGFFIFVLLFSCWRNDNTLVLTQKSNSAEQAASMGITHQDKEDTRKNGNSLSQMSDWAFDKVEDHQLIFKSGRNFQTHLYELKYIGQVAVANKAPYLIFSGRDCDECDANISIYIHSPSDGQIIVEHGQNRYHYPGTERDYENGSVMYKSRAFYGQILDNKQGVIWYQKTLTEDNKWINDIFLLDLTDGKKAQTAMKDLGQLQQTLYLLKRGKCKEIKGMNFRNEP